MRGLAHITSLYFGFAVTPMAALCCQYMETTLGIPLVDISIPTIVKPNGKTRLGDLVVKCANMGGDANLIIDVALIHEFEGNHMADVSLNGALRHAQPDKLLESTARTKVRRYREATRPGVT